MNQILQTNLNNTNRNSNLVKLKKILKIQFHFSIILIIVIIVSILYNSVKIYKQEKYSKQILNNYNITKLYSNLSLNEDIESSYIIGIIEISKINVHYPIFSNYDDELLKTSPCRFYGPLPGKSGNLCIAGHNYDNDKFFSKIITLNTNDEIIIYNNDNKKFFYLVSEIYEVKSDNLSPIYSYDKNSKQLTLVTCNNLNNNRIIVKAFCNN